MECINVKQVESIQIHFIELTGLQVECMFTNYR